MTISRRHRMLGGLLLASLLALVVDMLAGPPAPAPAAPASGAEQPIEPPELVEVLHHARTLLDRLRAHAPGADVPQRPPAGLRDLFRASRTAWPHPAVQPPVAAKRGRPRPVEPPPVKPPPEPPPFTQTHVLRGVVYGPAPLALIDETIVSRGATIDGYRVVEIRRDRVRLRGRGRLVTLVLAGPGKTASTVEPIASDEPPKKKTQGKLKSIFDLVDLLSGQ